MKVLSTVIVMLAANFALAGQMVLPSSATNVKLVDARYELVPTKTEVREIPGCTPYGDASRDCFQTIVLETAEVIRVSISYMDSTFGGGDVISPLYASVDYTADRFSREQIDLLKSAYPQWKNANSKIPAKFAKENFSLVVEKQRKEIQVVDMKRSVICQRHPETGELLNPSCEDQLVYKASWTMVTVAELNRK